MEIWREWIFWGMWLATILNAILAYLGSRRYRELELLMIKYSESLRNSRYRNGSIVSQAPSPCQNLEGERNESCGDKETVLTKSS